MTDNDKKEKKMSNQPSVPVLTQEQIDADPELKARQVAGLKMKELVKDFTVIELKAVIGAATVKLRELTEAGGG